MNFLVYQFDNYILDTGKRKLFYGGEIVDLSTRAYQILLYLIKNKGKIVEKDKLINNVWNDSFVEENNLAVHISALRRVFGEKRNKNKYIETISGKGYCFIYPTKLIDSYKVNENHKNSLTEVENLEGKKSELIAVLPFVYKSSQTGLNKENTADELTETYIINLSQVTNLRVISSSASLQYKNTNLDIQEICFQLGVKRCLIGNIYKRDNEFLVSLELINAEGNEVIFGKTYTVEFDKVFQINRNTIAEIVKHLKILPSPNISAISLSINRLDIDTYRLFLKARFLVDNKFIRVKNKEVLDEAVSLYQQIINKYPDFSQAYSGLAYIYHLMASFYYISGDEAKEKSKIYIKLALTFDKDNSEAYLTKGIVESVFEWNNSGAKTSFNKALSLNPNNSLIYLNLSMTNIICGEFEDAELNQSKGLALNPLDIKNHLMRCRILYLSGQYEKAIAQGKDILDIDSRLLAPLGIISICYALLGNYDEALFYLKELQKLHDTTDTAISYAYLYATFNKPNEALSILAEVIKNADNEIIDYYEIALVYCALGKADLAFEFFEKAISAKSYHINLIKIDPRLGNIRSNERFKSILKKINLA